MNKKIPDNIYETRCQWCEFRQGNENEAVPDGMDLAPSYHDKLPCSIMSIARWEDNECCSFHPNYVFGICLSCIHRNTFFPENCDIGVTDKRTVFCSKDRYYQIASMTCDKYKPNPYWMDTMKRQAAEGRIPRNFDPETFTPAENLETVKSKWDTEEGKLKLEREKLIAEKTQKKKEEHDGQMNMLDLLEDL